LPPLWTANVSYTRTVDFNGPVGCNATDGDVVGNQNTVWNESWSIAAEPTAGRASGGVVLNGTLTGSITFTITTGCTYTGEGAPQARPRVYAGSFSGSAPAQITVTEGVGSAVSVATYGGGLTGAITFTGPPLGEGDSEVTAAQFYPGTTPLLLGGELLASGPVREPLNYGPAGGYPTNLLNEGLEAVTAGGVLTAWLSRTEAVAPPPFDCAQASVRASFTATPSKAFSSNAVAFTPAPGSVGSSYLLSPGDGSAHSVTSGSPFSYTYKQPGEYTATLLVTDVNGCSATARADFTANAALTYAPTYYFHAREKYFPDTAETFLSRSQLVLWQHEKCGGKRYLAAGREARSVGGVRQPLLAADRLGGTRGAVYSVPRSVGTPTLVVAGRVVPGGCAKSGSVAANGSPRAEFVRYNEDQFARSSGLFLNMLDKPAGWRRGNLGAAKIYTDFLPGKYVAYWVFSPYNEWHGDRVTEIHEGDWERVVIRLDSRNRATQSVHYQHNCTPENRKIRPKNWTDTPKQDGTHPLVFVALGGHASYSATRIASVDYRIDNCGTPRGTFQDIIGGTGKQWRPWKAASTTADAKVVDVNRATWFGFGGGWGDRSNESTRTSFSDNYGPPAPGPHNRGVPRGWS